MLHSFQSKPFDITSTVFHRPSVSYLGVFICLFLEIDKLSSIKLLKFLCNIYLLNLSTKYNTGRLSTSVVMEYTSSFFKTLVTVTTNLLKKRHPPNIFELKKKYLY